MGNFSNDIIAINGKGIEILVSDLLNISIGLNTCFQNIEDAMNDLFETMDGELLVSLKNKFDDISNQFPVIVNNIEIYRNEFINIKSNYIKFDNKVSVNDVEHVVFDVKTGVNKEV